MAISRIRFKVEIKVLGITDRKSHQTLRLAASVITNLNGSFSVDFSRGN